MIYEKISGGAELLAWFGEEPRFHDAEIISLALNRTGKSELKVHGWTTTGKIGPGGYLILDKHAVVTFSLEGIIDLKLDGFSHQNVVNGLLLSHAKDRGRANYFSMPESVDDIDIELLPCHGLDGFIRAKKVEVSFALGHPNDRTA